MLDINLGDLLRRRAFRNPNVDAVVDLATGQRLTYAGLNSAVNQAAHGFEKLGVDAGDRVGLLLPNCVEFIQSYYGLAKIGGISVLLNWRLVADEIEFLLSDSGASVLVFGDDYRAIAEELHQRGSASVKTWIHVGPSSTKPIFAKSYVDVVSPESTIEPTLRAGRDDVLCLCYSSGTTGRPKGAMLTHESQMFAALSTTGSSNDFNLGDRYLLVMPMFHLGGLQPMEVSLYQGVTLVLMRAFDPMAVWEIIGRERITSGLFVPAMLNAMLAAHDSEVHDHSSIRNLWTAAAPVPVTLLEQCAAKGIGVLQIYGLTEAGGPGTILGAEDGVTKAGSAGKAYLLTDVRVARTDGTDCDPGEPGEVLIQARHVMKGYWNNPEATAAAIVDGWLHTGDVAVMDAEGYVTIQDRMKDMIISGGENVYPAEIENVILSHPDVREVAVIAQQSERWGESPLAVVVRTNNDLRADDVLKWCDGRMARFKLPKGVEFVDEIPRNASGKALKRILRDRFDTPAAE
jgi:acyl-CoA synthetase (AMP-forming)/AMP-acid ligase II